MLSVLSLLKVFGVELIPHGSIVPASAGMLHLGLGPARFAAHARRPDRAQR